MGLLQSFTGKKEESVEELEEKNARLEEVDKQTDYELSIAEKKAAIARLKERGLNVKQVGGWKGVMNWVKSH